jgi:hypothetical protein
MRLVVSNWWHRAGSGGHDRGELSQPWLNCRLVFASVCITKWTVFFLWPSVLFHEKETNSFPKALNSEHDKPELAPALFLVIGKHIQIGLLFSFDGLPPPTLSKANIWTARKELTQGSFLPTSFATSSLDTVQLGAFPVFQEEFLILTESLCCPGLCEANRLLASHKEVSFHCVKSRSKRTVRASRRTKWRFTSRIAAEKRRALFLEQSSLISTRSAIFTCLWMDFIFKMYLFFIWVCLHWGQAVPPEARGGSQIPRNSQLEMVLSYQVCEKQIRVLCRGSRYSFNCWAISDGFIPFSPWYICVIGFSFLSSVHVCGVSVCTNVEARGLCQFFYLPSFTSLWNKVSCCWASWLARLAGLRAPGFLPPHSFGFFQ